MLVFPPKGRCRQNPPVPRARRALPSECRARGCCGGPAGAAAGRSGGRGQPQKPRSRRRGARSAAKSDVPGPAAGLNSARRRALRAGQWLRGWRRACGLRRRRSCPIRETSASLPPRHPLSSAALGERPQPPPGTCPGQGRASAPDRAQSTTRRVQIFKPVSGSRRAHRGPPRRTDLFVLRARCPIVRGVALVTPRPRIPQAAGSVEPQAPCAVGQGRGRQGKLFSLDARPFPKPASCPGAMPRRVTCTWFHEGHCQAVTLFFGALATPRTP